MRNVFAIVFCPLLCVALCGCSSDASPPESPTAPAVIEPAPPAGKLSKAALKKQEKKRALKLNTMVKHDMLVKPSGD